MAIVNIDNSKNRFNESINNDICEIVSNESAKRIINELNNNQVINLEMILNIGKLDSIENNKRDELKKYNSILKYNFNDEINEISKYKHIRIWSSIYDSDDYCLLLYLCHKFKDKKISVIYSNEFNNYATTITSLTSNDLKDYLSKEHILKDYEINDFGNEWIKILKDNKELRFMLNGNVESVDINFLDEKIIERLADLGKVSIYKLVGNLIVNPLIPKVIFSDWIYLYLIDELINRNIIVNEMIDNKEYIYIKN